MDYFEDITGKTFGALTALRVVRVLTRQGLRRNKSIPVWEFRCECGELVEVRVDKVLMEYVQSCGCKQKKMRSDFGLHNRTHGCTSSWIYRRHNALRHAARTRGMDWEWQDFASFLSWFKRKYPGVVVQDRKTLPRGYRFIRDSQMRGFTRENLKFIGPDGREVYRLD